VSVFSSVARENGLGVSLMERLLQVYESGYDKKQLNYHRHSLLTNYRCHTSILMLASSLFYEFTLLSRSNSKAHPKAPFPLVFQCSSIEQDKQGDSSAENENEARILLEKVLEFLKSWPVPEKGSAPNVAVLAGTGDQV